MASPVEGLKVTFNNPGTSENGIVRTGHGIVDPKAIRMALAKYKPDGVSWTDDGVLVVTSRVKNGAEDAVSKCWTDFSQSEAIILIQVLDSEDVVRIVTHPSLLKSAEGEVPPEMKAKAAAIMADRLRKMN